MDNSLLIIAKEMRFEAETYIVSPAIKKKLFNWAQRLEDIAKRERKA